MTLTLTIIFILTSVLSAAVSSAMTVYLIRYFILKHKAELFSVAAVSQSSVYIEQGSNVAAKSKKIIDQEKKQSVRSFRLTKNPNPRNIKLPRVFKINTHAVLLSTAFNFIIGSFKNVFRALLKFIKLISKSVFITTNYVVKSIIRTLVKVLKFTYRIITYISYLPIRIFSKCINQIKKFFKKTVGIYLKVIFGLRAWFAGSYSSEELVIQDKDLGASISRAAIEDPKYHVVIAEEPQLVSVTKPIHLNVVHEPTKDSSIGSIGLHFNQEAYLSLVGMLLIILPLLLKLHVTYPVLVLLYSMVIILTGAYVLLKKSSPRVFWAIGIAMWVMLSLWYFGSTTSSQLGTIVIFLCAFLSVYALSSFIWYGLKNNVASLIEYALLALHPFLYLAGIYLLMINNSTFLVAILCISVAALYIFFAQEAKQKDTASKEVMHFVYVCRLVVIVALMALAIVITNGFLTVTIFASAILGYLYFDKKPETSFILLAMLVLFGQTLGITNKSATYTLIANERAVSYILSVALFAYCVHFFTKLRKHSYLAVFSTVLAAFTIFFGITIEILDIKVNTTILNGLIPEIILAFVYLSVSGALYFIGERQKSLIIKIVASFFTLYSIYFIFKNLL